MTFPRSCIYGLVDPETKAVRYIGQTMRGEKRVREHKTYLHKDRTHKGNWLRTLAARGLWCEVLVLEEVAEEGLDSAELVWIAWARQERWLLTNLTDGGEGARGTTCSAKHRAAISHANKGRVFSAEHRAKISSANKGRRLTPEQCEKIAASKRGKHLRPEHAAALRQSRLGAKHSPEACAKIGAAHRGKTSPAHVVQAVRKANSRPVVDTTTGVRYSSSMEAAKELGLSADCINRVVSGRYKQTGGHYFVRAESRP